MYDQYKQITNSRRVHDVRMGSAGPPEYFWLGQAYVFGIIYSLPLLIEIGLTDLTGPKQVLAANLTLFQHEGRLYPP